MNWKAILAHFDEETFEPRLYWQDLKVGIGGGLNEGVIAAFAAARLALTRDWDGCYRKDLGVFVVDPDEKTAAACCFSDGRIVHQRGEPDMHGRLAE
jgi:hypothetical protein